MSAMGELIHEIDDGSLSDARWRELLVKATAVVGGVELLAAAYPFVAVGVCTHHGCSPTLRLDDSALNAELHAPGGFFCPCHGSRFDLAGRVVRNVPAPTKLEIPDYRFMTPSTVQIG